ncbi:exodeoxyribonuclease V subunit beta [Mannheimia varigena]|uniref:exodeoxyribonuclease V subunit beta n=1 Tax=Mannheimia varigena TaxID=85404 RepID=UPI0003E348DB|nr:exodeoxyribonuclease V subunit beta [Mannheimia varigena]AHG77927.1 Exodeoxyribonuclease V [Mannheimia varigena USDA-ARS-USMARC-1312]
MNNLNTITLPLNKSVLIEASAGTGKTFTIANIYLRLLLGVGCLPLTVEQILVVTFTKAATEELKNRIRKNIQQCADFLKDKVNGEGIEGKSYANNLEFLEQFYPHINHIHEALLRLSIAEREIDTASVFTIHSFCQKMLVQFAFESGVRFDLDLQPNQSDLLKKLSEDVWREQFYPQGVKESEIISAELTTPERALNAVRNYLASELPEPKAFLAQDFTEQLAQYNRFIDEVKSYWKANSAELVEAIRHDLKNKTTLHGGWYRSATFETGVIVMNQWVNSSNRDLPDEFYLFTAEKIASGTKKSCEPMDLPQLAKNQDFLTAYQQQFENSLKAILLYQFLISLKTKLAEYKQSHPERGFDDLLTMLNQALKNPQTGKALAQKIRSIYPFAMIDEFQDTDLTQYEIFSQIFMVEQSDNGFIMIGDPKQSIYKFRGADIFTYLRAAKQAEEQFTLGKNWRSLPEVVQAVNNLFYFANKEKSPFLYDDIGFYPVEADGRKGKLISEQGHFVCYTSDKTKLNDVAEICAYQIHQQLKAMNEGKFGIEKNGEFNPFKPKDITILVRKGSQAKRIKKALAKRNIKSVYLAESASVFGSEIAIELCWILQAGLNPYNYKALLSALGSTLWGLSAAEIYRYKENEMLWDLKVNQFVEYSTIWKEQGILPMLHKIYLEQGIIERLKGLPNADRLITDLLHLTEILQETSQALESEAELVRWYEKQISSPDFNDEQQLRLESEEELIKIVTIHGSKGLQYPIVWLPFATEKSEGDTKVHLGLYRNTQGKLDWYLGEKEAKEQIQNETYAEDLRLFYVALTRAESQLNLVLPKMISGWSPLHYLLAEGELPKDNVSVADYFEKKQISADIIEVAGHLPFSRWESGKTEESYQAKTFSGNIRVVGQITSFTSLYAQHERFSEGKAERVIDLAQDRDVHMELIEPDYTMETDAFSSFQFPHGIKVGTVLHSFFEHCRFGEQIDKESVAKVCEQLGLSEEWIEPTLGWFERIFATPLPEANFCLKEIDETKRLNEWQFYLRLKNDKALHQLNALLKQHSPLAKNLPELQLPQLEGFVRGFVDCIVQMNGKFYLIDYKSNFLGYLPQNYSAENIQREMGRQRYDLQYLLYTLAVHRYLKARLGDNYDYERDFGGVAYLFLRAMNGEDTSGVYLDKPCKKLIEEMDLLFG